MKMSRFVFGAFAAGTLASSLGVVQVAYADDPLKPIIDTVLRDRSKGPCHDVNTKNLNDFSYRKELEVVAQDYAHSKGANDKGDKPAGYEAMVSFLGTGDPQARAINATYRRGAGDALRRCYFKTFGVGFWRDEKAGIDFVTIVLGAREPFHVVRHGSDMDNWNRPSPGK